MDDLFIITIAGRQILKGKKISTLNWKNKNNNSALNRGKFYYVARTSALRTLQRKCLSEKSRLLLFTAILYGGFMSVSKVSPRNHNIIGSLPKSHASMKNSYPHFQ